jgi:hypothetical protein
MKRGDITLENVLSLVLAVVIVAVIAYSVGNWYNQFTSNKEKAQADASLENFANFLSRLKEGESDEFVIYAPQDYWLVAYSKSESGPAICLGLDCICLCKEKDCPTKAKETYCKAILKPLKSNEKSFSVQLGIFEFLIKNNVTEYSILSYTSDEGTLKEQDRIIKPGVQTDNQYTLKSKDRDTSKIDTIILHHTGGMDFQGAYDTLLKEGYSVHYMIDRDGKIYYLVDEAKKAYHALGANENTIGIEIISSGCKNTYTDAQYNSLNSLIKDIISRWPNIKYDNAHIIGHFQTELGIGRKPDPSNFDWAKIGLPTHIASTSQPSTCPLA